MEKEKPKLFSFSIGDNKKQESKSIKFNSSLKKTNSRTDHNTTPNSNLFNTNKMLSNDFKSKTMVVKEKQVNNDLLFGDTNVTEDTTSPMDSDLFNIRKEENIVNKESKNVLLSYI